MPDVYSTQYTNMNAAPPVKVKANEAGGRVRVLLGEYTQSGVGNIGDIIHFGKVKKGDRLLPGGKCFFGAAGAGCTLKLGVTGSDAILKAATSIAAAGSMDLDAFLPVAAGGAYEVTADGDLIGTVAGAGIAATTKVTVHALYVRD